VALQERAQGAGKAWALRVTHGQQGTATLRRYGGKGLRTLLRVLPSLMCNKLGGRGCGQVGIAVKRGRVSPAYLRIEKEARQNQDDTSSVPWFPFPSA
jgi:hypothetical protein